MPSSKPNLEKLPEEVPIWRHRLSPAPSGKCLSRSERRAISRSCLSSLSLSPSLAMYACAKVAPPFVNFPKISREAKPNHPGTFSSFLARPVGTGLGGFSPPTLESQSHFRPSPWARASGESAEKAEARMRGLRPGGRGAGAERRAPRLNEASGRWAPVVAAFTSSSCSCSRRVANERRASPGRDVPPTPPEVAGALCTTASPRGTRTCRR